MEPSSSSEAQQGAIVSAVHWIEGSLTGSVASTMAIIAVAWFGMMVMSGRLSRPRALQLVLGCFIVFGAPSIAAGLEGILDLSSNGGALPPPSVAPTPPALPPQQPMAAQPYDPYAGAAMPPRR